MFVQKKMFGGGMEKLNRIGRPGDRSARAAGRLGVRRYGEDDVRVRDWPGTESWMESTVNLVWLRLRPAGKENGNERKASRNLAFEPSVFFFSSSTSRREESLGLWLLHRRTHARSRSLG